MLKNLKTIQCKSFSLIEVVIACGILMLFLGAGILVTNGALRNVVTNKDRLQAIMLANKVVGEIRAARDSGFFSGDLDMNGSPFSNQTLCFDKQFNQVDCASASKFYTVQLTFSDAKIFCDPSVSEFCDPFKKLEVSISWTDYGLLRNIVIPTYLTGCHKTGAQAATGIPVDVVSIIDTSDSMGTSWNSGSGGTVEKIQSARDVLTLFNNNLRSDRDRSALVQFPSSSAPTYCNSKPQEGIVRSNLTNDFSGLNAIISTLNHRGCTPLPSAMKLAWDNVLAVSDRPGSAKAIVVASDGLANIDLNGNYNPGAAPSQSIEQAQRAKDAGVLIFSIAIGGDFNSFTLKAISTANGGDGCGDTDPETPCYFYVATSDLDLKDIYDEISNTITHLVPKEICPGESWN